MTSTSPSHPLSIGSASTSITPEQPVQLAGQMHERVSESVHDPCTATALALEGVDAAGERDHAIMLCCDLVHVPGEVVERLRKCVAEQVPEFESRKLMVNATHTHTGPTLSTGAYRPPEAGVISPSEYAEFFIERAADVAVEAWRQRAPGGIRTALGHAAIGYNRRASYRDGTAQMYGKTDRDDFTAIEGGMDPGIELAFTHDAAGKLTGVLVNLACPSQVIEQQYVISADFWKPARDELRRRLGAELFVYPMCSAAGDQSPRDLVRRSHPHEPSMRTIEGMNAIGRRLALAVEDALHHDASPVRNDVVFAHRPADVSLPMRKVTATEVQHAREQLAAVTQDGEPEPASKNARLARRFRAAIERFETQGDDPRYTADIHVLRLGDLAIATNPFELFLDFGLQIKARSTVPQTMIVQLTNGGGRYLPTRRAVAGGSYSAMIYDNIVGPEGGDALVEQTLALIAELWPTASDETPAQQTQQVT